MYHKPFLIYHLFIINLMPKLIDNYVLSRKIGAGQYGEVFKGYDRATNNDIAVKSIRREGVKGKTDVR
jgi:serine/threonine-protein kinase ULK2